VRDALRLCFGTLTILPVRPPAAVDRRTASRAMVLAPVVGVLLAVVVLAMVMLLPRSVSPLLAAALTVAMLAVLTRGMHLDGLADTADGLGSRTPAEQALALMRQGDVGPFGVVTIVLTLLLQTAATAELVTTRVGLDELGVAIVLSRLVLPLLCSVRVPAARADGLGSAVAGSVGALGAAVAVIVAAAAALALAAVMQVLVPAVVPIPLPPRASVLGPQPVHLLGLICLPLLVTALFARQCVRRLGGITGDVLGACTEVILTAALIVAAL
jgi:adenosylcobinamide-GDP ribazoletransferase